MWFYFEDSCKTISGFLFGEVGCLTYQDNDTFIILYETLPCWALKGRKGQTDLRAGCSGICFSHGYSIRLLKSCQDLKTTYLNVHVYRWMSKENVIYMCVCIYQYQFSHSVVSDSATPWTAACKASLSINNSQSLLKLMSNKSVIPSNHLIICHTHFLLPSIFLISLNLYAAAAKSLQSCLTLCNLIDGSPPGSPIPGILQARTLAWVAISFSSAWKWKVKVKSLRRVPLLATPWTAGHQAPLSMGFSRQEYWSILPFTSPGDLPRDPNHVSYIGRQILYHLGSPCVCVCVCVYYSTIEKNEILQFERTWMDLEGIMLSEISQTEKHRILYDLTYMWNLKNKQKLVS